MQRADKAVLLGSRVLRSTLGGLQLNLQQIRGGSFKELTKAVLLGLRLLLGGLQLGSPTAPQPCICS
jgi:hypothetical protein